MPELAEVEFYRKCWNPGLHGKILGVALHEEKRVFRGVDVSLLKTSLPGSRLLRSEGHGKQMLFAFSNDLWLGVHLGMTGELRLESADFQPGTHDHLALFQKKATLVFRD